MAACDQIPGTEAHTIAKGEAVAASVLIDPSSAQFRNTRLVKAPPKPDDATEWPARVVCGEINGKNRQGAYVGFSRFLADPDQQDSGYLEPMLNSTEEEREREQRACTRGARGPIYSETDREIRLMQCERARELALEHLAYLEFDATYATLCRNRSDEEPTNALPNSSSPELTEKNAAQ